MMKAVFVFVAVLAAFQAPQVDATIDLTMTMAEIFELIETHSPINEILDAIEKLEEHLVQETLNKEKEYENWKTTNFGTVPEKKDQIKQEMDKIMKLRADINGTTQKIQTLRDVSIPGYEAEMQTLMTQVDTVVKDLMAAGVEREKEYVLYLTAHSEYSAAIHNMALIRTYIHTSLSSYVAEGTGANGEANSQLSAAIGEADALGGTFTTAPTEAATAAATTAAPSAGAFVALRSKMASHLRASAAEATGAKQELLLRAAKMTRKADSMDALFAALYELTQDLQSGLTDLEDNEKIAYEKFVDDHIKDREFINEMNEEMAVNRQAIADALHEIATHALHIAEIGTQIDKSAFALRSAQNSVDEIENAERSKAADLAELKAANDDEIATIKALRAQLNNWADNITGAAQDAMDNVAAARAATEAPTEAATAAP